MKTIFTDYNNCLTNVTNSILKYYGLETYHDTLPSLDEILDKKDYKNVVLLLHDGMSSNLIDRNLGPNSFLNRNKIKDIHAVFPTTTTASTTSVLSGLNPCEHGWLGWDLYFKEIDETVTMFLNTKKDTEEKVSEESISEKYYAYTSIIDLINEKYDAYQIVPFGDNSYSGLEEMNSRIIELCKQDNKKFIYAYSDEPDHSMHDNGTDSLETKKLFESIDKNTEKLCNSLDDTLLIVVADHGHMNSEGITLTEYPDFFNLLKQDIAIESRACAFYIKDGTNEEFEKLFHKYFDNDFILYSKEEVLEKKIFGIGKEHERFQESIGDYLAIATSNKYFRYNEKSIDLISMHAGITEDEVVVPLIIHECNKNNDYKLIATDFDGTLLDDNMGLSDRSKETLKLAKDYGYIMVGVTARTLLSAENVAPLDHFDYLILNNGAYLYDVKNNEGTYVGKISQEEALAITKQVEDMCEQIDYISGTTYYIYKKKKNSELTFIKDVDNVAEINEEISRMNLFLIDQKNVDNLCEQLKSQFTDLNPFIMQDSNSDKRWIVVNPKGLDKKIVLEKLGNDLNVSLQEMIFFGDGLNDLPIMEQVGCSVAVNNALGPIKEKADDIALSNNEDGVADYIERKLMKK